MSLVNSKSPLTVLAPFELFSNVPTQTSIEQTRSEEIRPVSQLNTGGYIEFDVNSNLNEYIKLDDIFLYMKFRVNLKKSPGALAADDWKSVSLVNNSLHSMFNQVDLSINDIQTTISLLTYAHKAYLRDLLFNTPDARQNYLMYQGWYDDTENVHFGGALCSKRSDLIEPEAISEYKVKLAKDTTTAAPTDNLSIGKTVEFCGRIHLDFLNQFKYLIGGTKMRFKFVLNRPEFLFMTKDTKLTPSVEFLDAYLKVPKAIVSEDLAVAHMKAISISPAKYPIDRFEVRTTTIDQGVTGKNIENVVNGQLPKKIYVAFVDNIAFNGSYTENPYLYKHHDIHTISCFVNGLRITHEVDFSKRLFCQSYLALCQTTNQDNNTFRMGISPRQFEHGSTIFAYNISQDGSDGSNISGHVNPPREGQIRFEVSFKTATQKTLNALFFCDFDNQISITSDRNPIPDF